MIPIFHLYRQPYGCGKILRPATFRERVMAQLVDGIILGAFCSLLFLILSGRQIFSVWVAPIFPQFILQVKPGIAARVSDWWWGGYFFTYVLPWGKPIHLAYPAPLLIGIYTAYYTCFVFLKAQTPGKMLKKLVVLTSENHGEVSLERSLLRWLAYLAALLPLGAGFWWGAWRDGSPTWPDILTGTRVYYFEP